MARTKAFDQSEVLEKALHIFWRDGFEATSMGQLVKGTGISRSSIYDTYGDKRQLFLAALNAYLSSASQQVINELNSSQQPKKTIKKLFNNTIKRVVSDTECKGCFMANSAVELAGADPEIQMMAKKNKENMVATFTSAIKRGQAAGDISSRFSAAYLAEFIFTAYNGLQVVGKFEKNSSRLKQSTKVALSLLDD